jgi:hypothetical protein
VLFIIKSFSTDGCNKAKKKIKDFSNRLVNILTDVEIEEK